MEGKGIDLRSSELSATSPLRLASFPVLTAFFSHRGTFRVKPALRALECLQLKTCPKSSTETFKESPAWQNIHMDALSGPFCLFVVFSPPDKAVERVFLWNCLWRASLETRELLTISLLRYLNKQMFGYCTGQSKRSHSEQTHHFSLRISAAWYTNCQVLRRNSLRLFFSLVITSNAAEWFFDLKFVFFENIHFLWEFVSVLLTAIVFSYCSI